MVSSAQPCRVRFAPDANSLFGIVMRKLVHCLLSSVLAGAAFICTNATAAPLLSADLFSQNDGLITREARTGREWLDMTATRNLSVDGVESGAGGFLQAGFRVAKLSEVGELFREAGIVDFSRMGSTANYSAALALMDLIGCMGQCSTPWRYSWGFARFDESSNMPSNSVARAILFIAQDVGGVAYGDGSGDLPSSGACGSECASPWASRSVKGLLRPC